MDGGMSSVTVHGLARDLGISKAGFYWHFKDREDLQRQLLDYWLNGVNKTNLSDSVLRELPPVERLLEMSNRLIDYEATMYEIAFRGWAMHDAEAARVVSKVDENRLGFVRTAFEELGFAGEELEMRALLYTCYETWQATTLPAYPREARRKMIASRIRLLTRDAPNLPQK